MAASKKPRKRKPARQLKQREPIREFMVNGVIYHVNVTKNTQ